MDRKKFIEIMDKHIHDHEDVIINGFTFSEFDDYEIDYWNDVKHQACCEVHLAYFSALPYAFLCLSHYRCTPLQLFG